MNRKTLVASLIATSLLAATQPSIAQAPARAPAAAPAPAPAPAAPVSAEQRAAIRELLDTTHTRESMTGLLQSISQNMRPQMGQMMAQRIEINTALSADQKQQVRATMQQPFEGAVAEGQKIIGDPKVVDDLIDRLVAVYARTFSLDEIKQLNAFYKSPLGQKSLTAIPAAGREAVQGMMSSVAPRLDALAESTVQKQIDLVARGAAPSKAAPAKAAPTTK